MCEYEISEITIFLRHLNKHKDIYKYLAKIICFCEVLDLGHCLAKLQEIINTISTLMALVLKFQKIFS